jgi:PAS domain-containing protein
MHGGTRSCAARPCSGLETQRAHRDGSLLDVRVSAAPLADGSGTTRSVILIFEDVRERKRAEEARGRLAAIVESSDDAIVGKSLDGIVTTWNAGAERLFGYSAAEMIGQPITRLFPRAAGRSAMILGAIREGKRVRRTSRPSACGRMADASTSP